MVVAVRHTRAASVSQAETSDTSQISESQIYVLKAYREYIVPEGSTQLEANAIIDLEQAQACTARHTCRRSGALAIINVEARQKLLANGQTHDMEDNGEAVSTCFPVMSINACVGYTNRRLSVACAYSIFNPSQHVSHKESTAATHANPTSFRSLHAMAQAQGVYYLWRGDSDIQEQVDKSGERGWSRPHVFV